MTTILRVFWGGGVRIARIPWLAQGLSPKDVVIAVKTVGKFHQPRIPLLKDLGKGFGFRAEGIVRDPGPY